MSKIDLKNTKKMEEDERNRRIKEEKFALLNENLNAELNSKKDLQNVHLVFQFSLSM
jgi:hypothetical protein